VFPVGHPDSPFGAHHRRGSSRRPGVRRQRPPWLDSLPLA
jgi:hypothetical protein